MFLFDSKRLHSGGTLSTHGILGDAQHAPDDVGQEGLSQDVSVLGGLLDELGEAVDYESLGKDHVAELNRLASSVRDYPDNLIDKLIVSTDESLVQEVDDAMLWFIKDFDDIFI